MRFGKTFTTYQLAREMGWTKVLVLTFKPAVEDSWQRDLESHADFHEWQFVSNAPTTLNWRQANKHRHVVWYLPNVASCEAMLDLLNGGYHSNFFRGKNGYEINAAFGGYTGVGKAKSGDKKAKRKLTN